MNNLLLYYIGAPLLVLFIAWISKIIWQAANKTKVKVLVHEAYFQNTNDHNPYYFIKVANLSTKHAITITHAWIKDANKNLHLINNERKLPHKLEPSDEWEVWIRKDKVVDQIKIFKNVRIKLTNNKIIKSKRNKKVPEEGYVAGSK